MTSSSLIETAYLSVAARVLSVAELESIVHASRRRNRLVEVTGLLLHAGGAFLQLLEGPSSSVDALYERIATDERHRDLVRVFRRPIEDRSFPSWRMGFEQPSHDGRKELQALSLSATTLRGFATEATELRARVLISQFLAGSWRRSRVAATAPPPSSG